MEQKECKLPVNVVNDVLQYLSTQPFKEVAGIIHSLQQAEAIEEEKLKVEKET